MLELSHIGSSAETQFAHKHSTSVIECTLLRARAHSSYAPLCAWAHHHTLCTPLHKCDRAHQFRGLTWPFLGHIPPRSFTCTVLALSPPFLHPAHCHNIYTTSTHHHSIHPPLPITTHGHRATKPSPFPHFTTSPLQPITPTLFFIFCYLKASTNCGCLCVGFLSFCRGLGKIWKGFWNPWF